MNNMVAYYHMKLTRTPPSSIRSFNTAPIDDERRSSLWIRSNVFQMCLFWFVRRKGAFTVDA